MFITSKSIQTVFNSIKNRNSNRFSLALQPLLAENSAEFSQADNSKTKQPRAMNFSSLDSLGSCESILQVEPKKPGET